MNAEDYVERAAGLQPLLEQAAPRMERERKLTPDVVAALHQAELYRLLLPRSLGGAELAPADFVRAIEAIAKADASTAWCLAQAGGCAMAAAYLDPAAAREIFGPANAVLAWGPPNPSGRALAVDGGYLLNGTWQFASGSRHATWLGAHAARVDRDGNRLPNPAGPQYEPTLLFPRSSATITDTWQVVGLKATGSDTYSVMDLFVPSRHVLVRDDPGTRREAGPLYKFTNYQIYGAAFAGVALGIARSTQDAFLALAREKTSFLAAAPLRENAAIQAQVAMCEVRLRAMRLFLLDTLRQAHDDAAQGGAIDLDRRLALRMASTYSTHQASDVVDACYQAAGATAIFESNPFERRFRDMHAVAQQSQARMMHLEAAGRMLLGGGLQGYAV
ncbi:MAG TPA: acyl-CoA dehydrogenase family protein [Stellaceae bacterium]|nr:acyl-CoA dehydrogenase family protein [Stellaceae bacterium]